MLALFRIYHSISQLIFHFSLRDFSISLFYIRIEPGTAVLHQLSLQYLLFQFCIIS